MKKLSIILISIIILVLIVWFLKPDQKNSDTSNREEIKQEITLVPTTIPSPEISIPVDKKIIPTDDLCPQISKEFVTETTGVVITRTSSINDAFINSCSYYLTDDGNSPYIAIIVNKNLNFEKHKQIAVNNKMIIKTDPRISGNHFIAWTGGETRISNINLYLDENNFLRIARNVERAVDNEGLIKLASAVSKRL